MTFRFAEQFAVAHETTVEHMGSSQPQHTRYVKWLVHEWQEFATLRPELFDKKGATERAQVPFSVWLSSKYPSPRMETAQ